MGQPTPQAPGAAPMQSQRAQQPKGSGRFTNIQKYLQANQGAGQRLAGGIGTKVKSQVEPQKQQAVSQASQIAEQVGKAQTRLGQGQALQQQVGQQGFDVVGFAAQQPNVQEFTQFRTGQAINEAELQKQAQANQMQAMQAQAAAQTLGQQLGTEGGRQQLLKQTFSPTKNYSIGQQRLDQLFLQQAAPQIQNLRSDVLGSAQQLGGILTENEKKQQAIRDIAAQEADVAKGLTGIITGKEEDVVKAAEARAEAVNNAREQAQKSARTNFQNLLEGKEISQDFAKQMGLKEEDRLLNVLRDQGGIDDYLKFNAAMLQGANQLASQEQRQKYDAIARLAGLDPDEMRIRQQSDAPEAVESTGQLRSRLDTRQKEFNEILDDPFAIRAQPGGGAFFGTTEQNLQTLLPLVNQLTEADRNIGTTNYFFRNQRPASLQNLINQINSNVNIGSTSRGSIGLTDLGINTLKDATKYQAMLDAYQRLANEGYMQNVRITDPTLRQLPKVD
jgi:hypothetical protein